MCIENKDIEVIVHEPVLWQAEFYRPRLENDLAVFKRDAGLVVTSRRAPILADAGAKMYVFERFGGN
jgi:UDPglucose 6-dehydrogenase